MAKYIYKNTHFFATMDPKRIIKMSLKVLYAGWGPSNLVPRVFSLSNMAAAGEKTLAHSRNHVTDLSTESGNLFKMAAKIKTERIWVRGLETEEKQTKWRQRQTQEKLKIWKNAVKSHRNTVEWYSDLIFCSMTFIYFKPERSSVHGT